jgi:RNA polymerase sigma factor for flagellar operon FliA
MASSQTINLNDYYGLVIYKAKKSYYRLPEAARNKTELNDLIQVGFIGLIKAADRYDSNKGASFATFSSLYIDGAVKDYLRKQDLLTQKERAAVKALEQAEEDLIQSLSAKPTVSELSIALRVSEDEVRRIQHLKKTICSIEEICQHGERGQMNFKQELPAFENPNPEVEIARKELWEDVDECLKNALMRYERSVLSLRTLGELTLKKTGQLLNIDINKVHRLEKKARGKMKYCLEGKGWSVTDIIEIFTD